MIFCSTHKSMPYSDIMRDASSCKRLKQIQRPTARHYMERKSLKHTALNFLSPSNPSENGRGGRKSVRARADDAERRMRPSTSIEQSSYELRD